MRVGIAVSLLLSMFFGTGASATTLLEMDIDSVATGAELVFVGTVLSSESIQDINGQYRTFVTFRVREVIKGSDPGGSLELSFFGGDLDGRGTVVSDLRRPEPGETGIYFVESLHEDLVNPLLGWSQGHFLIRSDNQGIGRVTTIQRQPVLDIQPMSDIPGLIRRPPGLVNGDTGKALGVLIEEIQQQDLQEQIGRGLTVEQFKERIRRLLEKRR